MVEIIQEPLARSNMPLTPREQGLNRAANILQLGAIANGIFALGLVVLGVLAGLTGGDLFITLADVFLNQYGGTADTALLIVVMLTLANVSALLVLMVGVLAQEFWSPIALIVVVVANLLLIAAYGYWPGVLSVGFILAAGAVIARDLKAYRINPLMLKELRERMRGARAFVVMTVYLGLMSGFAVLIYLIQTSASTSSATSVTGQLGRDLFRGIVGLELVLIVFIAPAFTSGAVSNERERKTYDLLNITLLPHQSFIIGKLESALGYILLLLLAAIPLQSIAFLFGGVSQTELLIAFVVLAVTAVALGTLGLFFSTLVPKTLTASIRAYGVAFGVTVGLPLAIGLLMSIFRRVFENAVNTASALEAGLIYMQAFIDSLNPVSAALRAQDLLVQNQGAGFYFERLRDGTQIPVASPWLSFTILYLVIAAVLIVFSVRGMRIADE